MRGFRCSSYHGPAGRLAVLLALSLVAAGCASDDRGVGSMAEQAEAAPGSKNLGAAPLFVLPLLDSGQFDLSNHTGKVVVVNFWATWCAPCLEEMPEFVRLQSEYRDRGLQFVGISVDEDGVDVVRPFIESLEINYPIVMDDGQVAQSYKGNLVIPSTFIIDRRGYIRSRYVGIVRFDTLVPTIESLLEEKPAA